MKTMKNKLRKLTDNKGSSPISSVIVILVLTLIFVLILEIFTISSISDNVHQCVQNSIKTITTMNETNIYPSLRENKLELDEEELSRLITTDELIDQICSELGLTNDSGKLYRYTESGGYGYVIYDLSVNSIYIDAVNTLCFEATGKIDIPLNAFKDITPDITIDLNVKSLYASKLRAVE